ncbi:hypothetical protein B566_EDAN015329 [Ephemera danica]|nr:hypothetical protein B566_EDAN015329 [Ephemera danica]
MTLETNNQSNHKTIFVLDHTPYFGYSCENPIEFDFTKSRGPGFIPLAPVCKSLWTCSVESALEYCRIAWDVYPQGKLVNFIVSNSKAHKLNTWNVQQQNLQHLYQSFATIGAPPPLPGGPEFTVVHGLKSAVEVLCECSESQHEKRTNLADSASKVQNRTRVICITSARDNSQIRSYEEYFLSMLLHQNKIAAASDNFIPIHHCHLVMINIHPNNITTEVVGHPLRDMSAILSVEAHSVKAGGMLANKLSHLILQHYNLASTTVTGIPMKEEQNASSSANYDVEIYETVTLKWCTPRSCSATELQHCTNMHRITPVDVNSRPSSCLINFLLSGRSVMLEMPRRSGGKVMSHLLAAHGGEIFIHTLTTSRSVLEDPPSIREKFLSQLTIPQYLDPLLTLMAEEKMNDEQVVQCKQVIYSLIDQHRRVLDCLLECRNKQDTRHTKSEKVELDQALRELDHDLQQRASVIRATTDSPLSPPPQAQIPRPLGPAPTLLDIWLNKINTEQTRKKPDFIGRTATPVGTIARLYPNLKFDGEENENDQMETQGSTATIPK